MANQTTLARVQQAAAFKTSAASDALQTLLTFAELQNATYHAAAFDVFLKLEDVSLSGVLELCLAAEAAELDLLTCIDEPRSPEYEEFEEFAGAF